MDKNIQGRFAEMIETLCGGNKSEFCRRIGRSNDAVKDIIGGRRTYPGYELIYDVLSSDLGINPTWLLLGDGEMLVNIPKQSPSPSVSIGTIQTVNIGNWSELVDLLKQK